jgi:NitT/TauT family transport system ATP-binding protein
VNKILQLNKVSLTYHSSIGETEALKNINIEVEDGEFVAIVGPSGCGKTTILSLISGLLKPTTGQILIENKIITKVGEKTGYMFQKDHLFEWRTIKNNILLGLELKKGLTQKNLQIVEKLIKKYGLEDFVNYYPHELSGGMRQRVALIRTLALNPKILLLDEPFTALDFQTRLEVCDDVSHILKEEHKTAIFVTHDIGEAVSIADRVIVLTARPASIKCIFDVKLSHLGSPLKRRESLAFNSLFEKIYKELKNG